MATFPPDPVDWSLQLKVERLLADYAHCIDDDRLEDWPGFFTDPCRYQITSADNHARGLPVGLFFAHSRAMLEDRVTALRKANIYEPQRYRHILSAVRIVALGAEALTAQTSFLNLRIMHSGETSIFASGRYLDRIVFDAQARFAEKIVVLDSDRIDTLLAIPL